MSKWKMEVNLIPRISIEIFTHIHIDLLWVVVVGIVDDLLARCERRQNGILRKRTGTNNDYHKHKKYQSSG